MPPPPEFPESIETVTQRASQLVGKVAVPRNLERPHHLITKLLAKDGHQEAVLRARELLDELLRL